MRLDTKALLTLAELTPREFSSLISYSARLKKDLKRRRLKPLLGGKTLTMIFQKPSTRTRMSFEIGMSHLGGHAVNLAVGDMQLSRGESIEDTARTLSRYTDCIMARVYEHAQVEILSKHASVPVINGLSNTFHPCQILADFLTIREHKGRFRNLKIAWVGDGSNVCNSMIYGTALAGSSMSIATPKGFEPDMAVVEESQKSAEIGLDTDPVAAVRDADVVVTDTWSSIHNSDSGKAKKFLPRYQVNQRLMRHAAEDAIFLHCLPAKRGMEVDAETIDGPRSAVWDEAENRLHTQNALLCALMGA